MNCIKNYLTPLLPGILVLSLSSCASTFANPKSDSVSLAASETLNPALTNQLDAASSIPEKPHQKTPVRSQPLKATDIKTTFTTQSQQAVTVSLYQVDNQCKSLVAHKVAVPANNSVDAAVGKVIQKVDSGDLNLAGYRVNVNPKSGIATVDLRLSPNAKRQFASLSNCEQLALFGSLQKTLTANPKLKIKSVRFTNQGNEIVL